MPCKVAEADRLRLLKSWRFKRLQEIGDQIFNRLDAYGEPHSPEPYACRRKLFPAEPDVRGVNRLSHHSFRSAQARRDPDKLQRVAEMLDRRFAAFCEVYRNDPAEALHLATRNLVVGA